MKPSAPHTLLLVDDHPMMRRGIRQLIELESDLCVVGEANNGEEAIELLQSKEFVPDIIVLDLNMPKIMAEKK